MKLNTRQVIDGSVFFHIPFRGYYASGYDFGIGDAGSIPAQGFAEVIALRYSLAVAFKGNAPIPI
jgi:hypothetical protein